MSLRQSWTGADGWRSVWKWVVGVGLIAILTTPLYAQETTVSSPTAATLHVTSTSESANQLFWDGMAEAQNIRFTTATEKLDMALAIDANFGMTLALKGFVKPGLTRAERTTMISRAIGMMGDATPAEITVATALREWRAGNQAEAKDLLEFAAALTPGDPSVGFYHTMIVGAAGTPDERITAWRTLTDRFPDYGPAQNILAYQLYVSGDERGGLEMARKYLETAPNHPNSHDTFAEISQWAGSFEVALTHYAHTLQMDPTWVQGLTGQAEVLQMMDEGDEAREKLVLALDVATTDNGKVNLHRAIGNSFALDGNRRAAIQHLTTAANMATEIDNANLAAQAYQQMAIYEAILGRRNNIGQHLAAAATANGVNTRQIATVALANAINGDLNVAINAATVLADEIETSNGNATLSHNVNAVIKLRQNDVDGALWELGESDPGNILTKALLAEAYKAAGRTHDAATLRTDVLNDRRINLLNTGWVIAHLRAERM